MNDELAGLQKELLALLARAESELNAEDMECFRSVGASALDSMRRAVLVDAGAEAALPERYGIIGESEPMRCGRKCDSEHTASIPIVCSPSNCVTRTPSRRATPWLELGWTKRS